MEKSAQEKILYRRVADELFRDLRNNPVAMTKSFPRIREIQQRFSCSGYTAHRALQLLKKRGVLNVQQGRRSIPVKLPRAAGRNNGMILLIFPTWDSLGGHSFAADFVLGASTALAQENFAAIPCPCASWAWLHGNPAENERVLESLQDKQYSGIIWANPTLNESALLAQLESRNAKVICSFRTHNGISFPKTLEDFTRSFEMMVDDWKNRKISKVAIHAPYNADHTYMPHLSNLRNIAFKAGIKINDDCILNRIDEGNTLATQCRLLNAFLETKQKFEAIFSFSPEVFNAFKTLKNSNLLRDILFGCLSKQTSDTSGAEWIIESAITEHGRSSAMLMVEYIQTGEKPKDAIIPSILKIKDC